MIITVTPNPSLDKTVELSSALAPGEVQRAVAEHAEPGGKGVNISRALDAANMSQLALLPGAAHDPVLQRLDAAGLSYRAVDIDAALRTNITITDPTGITTKINEPGPQLGAEGLIAFEELIRQSAQQASWVAMAGSLPPGVPQDFYARITTALREGSRVAAPSTADGSETIGNASVTRVAVDSSGPALVAAVTVGVDLIKPNAEELLELHAQLLGTETSSAQYPSAAALEADTARVAEMVRDIQRHGDVAALVTLGAHGALYVPRVSEEQPALHGTGPAMIARSTVGAGDASLAGWLLAHQWGASPEDCLRQAVAQGRAAASLPGSTMPTPDDLRLLDVVVEEFTTNSERQLS